MRRRVKSPDAASRRGWGEDEGRAASRARKGEVNGPAIGSTSLGIGLTVGRPELRSRQSRFESGLPKNPNKRGRRRRQAAPTPAISTPGIAPPKQ